MGIWSRFLDGNESYRAKDFYVQLERVILEKFSRIICSGKEEILLTPWIPNRRVLEDWQDDDALSTSSSQRVSIFTRGGGIWYASSVLRAF